ncbi:MULTISPECIES: hypothetical protein [Actinosynnema]|uniref:hypothetical protein n=1 Tax=Actinosynnema TaxID=40566 RepID=UPI0020A25E89|nr:hypothetical protein [Actinosynnema pretiosum]MCP2093547.1 hypothetical protein [Actinosynnema pretiosum]
MSTDYLTQSWTGPDYEALVQGMVTDNAPRVFAVVEEDRDDPCARVAAWGMAFAEHAEVVSVERDYRAGSTTPERAAALFSDPDPAPGSAPGTAKRITARLVWA